VKFCLEAGQPARDDFDFGVGEAFVESRVQFRPRQLWIVRALSALRPSATGAPVVQVGALLDRPGLDHPAG